MLASYRMLYAHQCRKFGCRIVHRHLSHFMVVHSKHILNVIEYKIEWWCYASCPRIQPRIGWIIQKICRRKDIEFAWLHADYRSIHSKTRFWEKQKNDPKSTAYIWNRSYILGNITANMIIHTYNFDAL